MKNNLLPLLLCVAFAGARAQTTPPELLTAEAAVGIALQQNFDIRLIRADAEIARLNNTKGNAGNNQNLFHYTISRKRKLKQDCRNHKTGITNNQRVIISIKKRFSKGLFSVKLN
jgi:hypothetical protein